ncbi:MAG: T9SS type A sorting domain-containing protein [Bacteroidota bacterium]
MKFGKKLVCTMIAIYSLMLWGNAQDIELDYVENNVAMFSLDEFTADHIIWFFGDGHFSNGPSPRHHFEQYGTNSPHTITAYYMDPYIPMPPDDLEPESTSDGIVVNPPTQPYSNPSYHAPGTDPIRVNLSAHWSPVAGKHIIYTVVVTNDTGNDFAGDVFFCNPGGKLTPLANYFDSNINNSNWFAPYTSNTSCNGDWNDIGLRVGNVPPGQQRVAHLKLQVDSGLSIGTEIITEASLYHKTGAFVSGTSMRARTAGTPHDPNFKITDRYKICINSMNTQEIIYEIHYQNEGDFFANKIDIKDEFSNTDLISHVEVLDYTFEPEPPVINSNGIRFKFNNVELPGSNQYYPTVYTFEQSQGFIRYKVHLKSCLLDNFLTTRAHIFFNNIGPVSTNELITYIAGCYQEPQCSSDFTGGNGDGTHGGNGGNPSAQDVVDVGLYPNPFGNQITLEIDGEIALGGRLVVVTDVLGNEISRFKDSGNNFVAINTEEWNQGVHLVTVINGSFQKTIKCIKQN